MNFVILRTFDSYIQAHMLLGRMEEEGFDCWLKDENIVTINPILSNVVGGIKLMVLEEQKEKAEQLLQQFDEQEELPSPAQNVRAIILNI